MPSKKNINFVQEIVNDRKNIMTTSLVSTLEVLKKDFKFDENQLKEFADKYVSVMQKNLKVKKK